MDFWKGKNVFLTGCTGFLGSYLAKELVNLGANVTGLVRDVVPKSYLFSGEENNDLTCYHRIESMIQFICQRFRTDPEPLKLEAGDVPPLEIGTPPHHLRGGENLYSRYKKINMVIGSLEDEPLLERALGEYEIDTVFHVAAQAIVGIANRNPISTFEANIRGTYNLLEAARRSPLIKRIVVASSDKAYGDQIQLPYNEDMPLQGRHPYDVSKSCTDLIAQAYHKTYALPVCITRCGNLYGGGDLNFNRIIPQTIQSVLNGEAPVIRSDGTFIRDYFYVEDAVKAYLLLAERMNELKLEGQAFNFSNEIQLTVTELVNKVLMLMNSDLKPKILNQGSNEIKHQYLSAKKAKELLGWTPYYTIEEGLLKTIDWYKVFFGK